MRSSAERRQRRSVRPGDIYEVAEHRIACGDARDPDLVKRLVGTARIALVCTDPPYGCAVVESKEGFAKIAAPKPIANDHVQGDGEYREFTRSWLAAAAPHLEPKNACYVFNSDRMVFALREGMRDAGWTFSQLLVWVKTHAVVGRMDYLPQHELVAYGWRGRHAFRKSKDKSVLVFPKPSASRLHPTMKPVPLLRRLILNSTSSKDVVYDPFLGSGSCAVACADTGRACYGIELDPGHCATAIARIERHTGAKAVRL